MNLHKLILTENACYKAGRKITVKGIMVHSTGANNPNLKRYVGPDDGLLGKNQYGNHWNTYHPGGREVCVHAFIGKLADGTIATYQTLPWNHRGWHAGGSANNTHIGFEICEDGLSDYAYFKKVYREAVELCAYLCKEYGLTEQNIICHSEGYKQGVASNHGDVMHWFPKHGKSMDTFRAEVKALLATTDEEETETPAEPTVTYPEKLTTGYYRVRKTWKDSKSQVGAYRILSNAKAAADKNPGTFVFANDGTAIYPADSTAEPDYRVHTVVKGDTLWDIAVKYLGKGSRYTEIKKLNGLVTRMRKRRGEFDAFEDAERDVEFHMAVAEASHNIALVHVTRGIFNLMRMNMLRSREALYHQQDNVGLLDAQHAEIAKAIAIRDPAAARKAANLHLSFIQASLREVAMTDVEQQGARSKRVRSQQREAGTD